MCVHAHMCVCANASTEQEHAVSWSWSNRQLWAAGYCVLGTNSRPERCSALRTVEPCLPSLYLSIWWWTNQRLEHVGMAPGMQRCVRNHLEASWMDFRLFPGTHSQDATFCWKKKMSKYSMWEWTLSSVCPHWQRVWTYECLEPFRNSGTRDALLGMRNTQMLLIPPLHSSAALSRMLYFQDLKKNSHINLIFILDFRLMAKAHILEE